MEEMPSYTSSKLESYRLFWGIMSSFLELVYRVLVVVSIEMFLPLQSVGMVNANLWKSVMIVQMMEREYAFHALKTAAQ